MKKILYAFVISSILFSFSSALQAQTRGINYQAVARDASGTLIANQVVNVSFHIREGAVNGTIIYNENHSPTTNDFALISVVIGDGSAIFGDFSSIDWAGNSYFLEVEINGASVGVTEFLSVPYSKVATQMKLENLIDVEISGISSGDVLKFNGSNWKPDGNLSPWTTTGNNISYSSGNVGIGTNNPTTALHISGSSNVYDIQVDGNTAFASLNTTTGSGNVGLRFQSQGNTTGWILRRSSNNAIYISGEANPVVQPNLVVASSGRVGIGTASPSYPLHITADTISINHLEIANLGSSNLGLDGDIIPYIGSAGGYDLGNNNATQHWDDVVASAFITFSDARLKNQVTGLSVGLKEIMKLRPVQYVYNPKIDIDGRLRFGLLAQEVEPILPNVVINEDVDVNSETGKIERKATEYKSMNYMDLVPVLIQAVQDQQEYIQQLEKRLEKLENKE